MPDPIHAALLANERADLEPMAISDRVMPACASCVRVTTPCEAFANCASFFSGVVLTFAAAACISQQSPRVKRARCASPPLPDPVSESLRGSGHGEAGRRRPPMRRRPCLVVGLG